MVMRIDVQRGPTEQVVKAPVLCLQFYLDLAVSNQSQAESANELCQRPKPTLGVHEAPHLTYGCSRAVKSQTRMPTNLQRDACMTPLANRFLGIGRGD